LKQLQKERIRNLQSCYSLDKFSGLDNKNDP